MEIDQKWVADAAGWKAIKEAKGLIKADAVVAVQRTENLFTGIIGFGKARKRPKVRIHSKFDISTSCTCIDARRNGSFCQHAVALILYWLEHGDTKEKSEGEKKEVTQQPILEAKESTEGEIPAKLQVHFPSNILDLWAKRKILPLRIALTDNESDFVDQKTLQLFSHISEEILKKGGMLQAKEAEAAVLLKTLAGSEGVFRGERSIQIAEQAIRPELSIERSEANSDQLILSLENIDHLCWQKIGPSWWSMDENSQTMFEGPALGKFGIAEDFLITGKSEIDERKFIQHLEEWDQQFAINWQQDEFQFEQAIPRFKLKIQGGSKKLIAQLIAKYPDGPEIVAFSMKPDSWSAFPYKSSNTWNTRNMDAEEEAVERICLRGFSGNAELVLEGDQQVAEFLAIQVEDLEQDWEVSLAHNIHAYRSNLEPLRPQLDIAESSSGEDWLAFDFDFRSSDGTRLSRSQVQRLLQQGKSRIRGKSGKELILSPSDFKELEETLLDTNPEQKNGKYEVSSNYSFYLKNKYKYNHNSLNISNLEINLNEEYICRLRDYQLEGIQWLIYQCSETQGAVLADDMGLGKTLQTLSAIAHFSENSKPALVVCPKSLLGNWKAESEKFFPELQVVTYHGSKREKLLDQFNENNLILTTYDIVARDLDKLQKCEFQLVVLDEASLIRNPDTEMAKAVRKLNRQSSIALTGTPVENSIRDLWSIFQFTHPGYLGSRSDFKLRYEKPLQDSQNIDPSVSKRLRQRVEPFMLRRTKSQVAKELPKKSEIIEFCEMSQIQRSIYKDLMQKGDDVIREFSKKNGQQAARMQVLTLLLRLRQTCCDTRLLKLQESNQEAVSEYSGKLERLLELLESAQNGEHKTLIFSQFTGMLQLISLALTDAGIDFCYLDGSTSNRQKQIDRFQSKEGPPVFLISLKAGGYGLNLTAADVVIHFDPWWNPAVEAQATDRAHRIGQTKPVTVYKLVTKNTVEEKILHLQSKKKKIIGQTLGEEAPLMRGLNDNDLQNIFD